MNDEWFFYATKKADLKTSVRAKKRRLGAEANQFDEVAEREIGFEAPKSLIGTEILLGDLTNAVNKCRDHLYKKIGFKMLVYQSAPKEDVSCCKELTISFCFFKKGLS